MFTWGLFSTYFANKLLLQRQGIIGAWNYVALDNRI